MWCIVYNVEHCSFVYWISCVFSFDLFLISRRLMVRVVRAGSKMLKYICIVCRYIDEFSDLFDRPNVNSDQVVSHPINAFLLVKHLSADWERVRHLLTTNLGAGNFKQRDGFPQTTWRFSSNNVTVVPTLRKHCRNQHPSTLHSVRSRFYNQLSKHKTKKSCPRNRFLSWTKGEKMFKALKKSNMTFLESYSFFFSNFKKKWKKIEKRIFSNSAAEIFPSARRRLKPRMNF